MNTRISIKDKKCFLEWFLKNFQLKKRESVWILNYIITHPEILKNIHFVREAKFCPRSIIISTLCSDQVPFRFYKKHIVTTDADKSFHDIRMNRNDVLFIQLNFKNDHQNSLYASVLEDNPFIPNEYYITNSDKENAKKFLDHMIYVFHKQKLLQQIDEAIDQNDRDKFHKLSTEINSLNKNYNKKSTL